MIRTITLILCFSLILISANAQQMPTLANLDTVLVLNGPVPAYNYQKILPIPAGGYLMLSDFYNTGRARQDYYIQKLDSNGNPLAALDFYTLHNASDYGTNFCVKDSFAVFVGFTSDSTLSASTHFVTIKLNVNTMDTAWVISESIDSAITQAPFAVVVDWRIS